MFKRFMFGYKYGREIIKINFCFIIEIKIIFFDVYSWKGVLILWFVNV